MCPPTGSASCQGFNWARPGCPLLPCNFSTGCCWLKQSASSATMVNITDQCPWAGSYVMRAPKAHDAEAPTAPTDRGLANARNVLYMLVDDMRPDLQPYAQSFMYTPNLKALAATALTFSRAYCNIAVCSPSRMSFLTGRYPATTKVCSCCTFRH